MSPETIDELWQSWYGESFSDKPLPVLPKTVRMDLATSEWMEPVRYFIPTNRLPEGYEDVKSIQIVFCGFSHTRNHDETIGQLSWKEEERRMASIQVEVTFDSPTGVKEPTTVDILMDQGDILSLNSIPLLENRPPAELFEVQHIGQTQIVLGAPGQLEE